MAITAVRADFSSPFTGEVLAERAEGGSPPLAACAATPPVNGGERKARAVLPQFYNPKIDIGEE